MESGTKIYSNGDNLNIRDKPSLTGGIVKVVQKNDLIGIATGNVITADRYTEDNTPIQWVELQADPYGYPPVRYVASKYIQQATVQTSIPTTTIPDNYNSNTTDLDQPEPKNNANKLIFGGLIVAILTLTISLLRK